jgi:hypothetical protein
MNKENYTTRSFIISTLGLKLLDIKARRVATQHTRGTYEYILNIGWKISRDHIT